MPPRVLIVTMLLLLTPGPTREVWAGAYRLTAADGVIHMTNVPSDLRDRTMREMSGTASGRLRPSTPMRGMYSDQIRRISTAHGVEATLVEAVIRAESAFNPAAVSPKGARGLMQLMPETASGLGVRDSFNPRENIEAGVRHLRYLLDRYAGNVRLAIAAYNAGEGAVDAHRGIPPYPETQQYVERVLRWAGLDEGRDEAPQALYRYVGPDGSLIYSNMPPRSHPAAGR